MKLQNLIIIFLAVALPVILVLAVYVELQVDTAATKARYTDYLITAAHETINAYQLNTTNDKYSSNTDPKLRSITAALNIFSSNMASSFNSTGASRSTVMAYVPALLFTMYDGYYIYNPTEHSWDGDTWGSGEILSHELKPYVHYSKEYTGSGRKVIINYTLDNYIAVFDYNTSTGDYTTKAGYLEVIPDGVSFDGNDGYAYDYYYAQDEALDFTHWYNTNIASFVSRISGKDMEIKSGNLALPGEASGFNDEKYEVIQNAITANLMQVLHVYGKEMPRLTGNDWNTIMNNVCFIAFMQDIPVGTTTYNNYTIAISTRNNEKVDETAIYYVNEGAEEGIYEGSYHRLWCDKLDVNDNTKAITQVEIDNLDNQKEKDENGQPLEIKPKIPACYHCVVRASQSSLEYMQEFYKNNPSEKRKRTKLYYTALAEQKYKLVKSLDYINGVNN